MRSASLILLFSMAFMHYGHAQTLQKNWETDTVFKVPESVKFSKQHQLLFVSNIEGTQPWAKDGKGSIAKLNLEGKLIDGEWVTGLDAPKGMAIRGNRLFVADLKTIKTIDIKQSNIIHTLKIPGTQTLNDLTIDDKGILYVSDSRGKKVYRIKNNTAEVWLDSISGLRGPNGLLFYKDNLYVLDAGALYETGPDKKLTKITEGMEGGTDGIEAYSDDAFIVSCWSGVIYFVKKDGTKTTMLDTRKEGVNSADIGYHPEKKVIYVPTFWKNKVVAYQLQ